MRDTKRIGRFDDVDRDPVPRRFVEYLEAASAVGQVQAVKRRTIDLLELEHGESVLEVGCGVGDEARAMAERVVGGGRVVGVDRSEEMVREAIARSRGTGIPVEFRVGDAERLDFPDATFDAYRSERTYMHLAEPERAVREAVRVVKPGGRILVMEPDWDALVVDSSDIDIGRRVTHAIADAMRSGTIGRRLPRLFRDAGLRDLVVEPGVFTVADHDVAMKLMLGAAVDAAVAQGAVGEREARAWTEDLARRGRENRFFMAGSYFVVLGRRPRSRAD